MVKRFLAWALWAANIGIIISFWLYGNGALLATGNGADTALAMGRLFGLLATYCALVQFVLMGRAGWLEPLFGLDKLAIFHRRNGLATFGFLLLHSPLIMLAYSQMAGIDSVQQFVQFTQTPVIAAAMLGQTLFYIMVASSIYITRKHLKFETWYGVHLIGYLAIALVPLHQLTLGGDLATAGPFQYYWIFLYLFTTVNVLVWRFALPVARSLYFGFRVEKTVSETVTATSVYISGKNLQHFRAKGGQFVLVRFLAKPFIWQEHPFSLSAMPNSNHLRLTIRHIGDYTSQIPTLQPGTKVVVSGPYGAFTHEQQVAAKVLYVAGGVGITPIRAMIEERVGAGSANDAALVYGNRTEADTVFLQELQTLAAVMAMPLHNVVSDQKDYTGETGYVTVEKISRLVPDFIERDIYLCGPPPMMFGLIKDLKAMGVPQVQLHYERFSLHKQ